VGSGLTGLSAALRLAESGREVAVIDTGEIAGGASSINGGMVSPDVKAGIRSVEQRHGEGVANKMWQSTVRSVELVEELSRRPGIDAITHRGGMAALGNGARELRAFERRADWYRVRFGVDWEVIGPGEVQRIVGGDSFDAALYQPGGIGVHPARLAFGLAAEVDQAGAILVAACEAKAMVRNHSGLTVNTNRGLVEAGEVILATNGYTTPSPNPELARLVVPVGSYIIVTEPVGKEIADSVFPTGANTYTRKRLLNYMRRTHDDRILVGGRRNLHPGLDLAESAEALREAMIGFWPQLEDADVSHVWGGKLGVPFDLTPHIGQVDGAWYALGYAGHGVGLSLQLGHELAGMLLGEDPTSVYATIPHDSRFYYKGRNAWFLTPASVLYRALDRLGV
jgi:glycine/D-amino acid oxidase-like deaminating enzyme